MLFRSQRAQHVINSINFAEQDFKSHYARLPKDALRLYTDVSDKEDKESELVMDVNVTHYPLRDFIGYINEFHAVVRDYDKTNSKRNKYAVAKGKLAKHMMHLVRLYYMCFDILLYHKVITYRKNEHDLLMSIRNGDYLDENDQPTKEFYTLVDKLENRLSELAKSSGYTTSVPRVFQYPKGNKPLYNGEFAKDNFTTKRFIDIGNIPRSTDFSYGVTCCGYDLDTELNSDGEILAKAVDGETTSIDLTFESPITFINPSSDNKDYGNVVYSHAKGSSKDGYRIFKASECSLMFKYNTKDSSDYDVYTKTPKAIKVLWDGMRGVIDRKSVV